MKRWLDTNCKVIKDIDSRIQTIRKKLKAEKLHYKCYVYCRGYDKLVDKIINCNYLNIY